MSRYVEHGFFDCGLTGLDWIEENGSDVQEVCDLVYSKSTSAKARWVLVVPQDSPVTSVKQLEGKLIATEAVAAGIGILEAGGNAADAAAATIIALNITDHGACSIHIFEG